MAMTRIVPSDIIKYPDIVDLELIDIPALYNLLLDEDMLRKDKMKEGFIGPLVKDPVKKRKVRMPRWL